MTIEQTQAKLRSIQDVLLAEAVCTRFINPKAADAIAKAVNALDNALMHLDEQYAATIRVSRM